VGLRWPGWGVTAATIRDYGVPPERLLVLPNGVEIATRTEWGPDVQAHRLLFVGNLHYQPNAEAVTALIAMVARLRAHGMLVCARIVGRGPAPASSSLEVVLRGSIPGHQFDAEFRGISLVVAPLAAGSGMKMKMLDYLATGLPVLAIREAVTGLPPAVPGVVVCDDLAVWQDRITELLAVPSELAEVGRAGRRFVEQHHDWEDPAARAASAYRAWCAQSAPLRRRAAASAKPLTRIDDQRRPMTCHQQERAAGGTGRQRSVRLITFCTAGVEGSSPFVSTRERAGL
jgi:glycosyltransferase involved in cell wall biosynthesis